MGTSSREIGSMLRKLSLIRPKCKFSSPSQVLSLCKLRRYSGTHLNCNDNYVNKPFNNFLTSELKSLFINYHGFRKVGHMPPEVIHTSRHRISSTIGFDIGKGTCFSCLCGQRRNLHTQTLLEFPQGKALTQTDNQTETKDPDVIGFIRQDIGALFKAIRREVGSRKVMKEIATYYFDGRGKSLRPLITILMSRAVNNHLLKEQQLLDSQKEVAKIIEMIHASSLLHDDVIDGSDTRRGKPAVHSIYSHRRAVMVGDYILSVAATMAARLRHEELLVLLSQVLVDLVEGEFMQLGSKEKEDERFNHYLKKTFNKTASLIAFSCKAVALLADASAEVQEIAFQYGKNCGIAFQLVDDLLDFTSTASSLGKPNLNDLKSGLATAPVLFACEKFPELNAMIMRRFQEPDDAKRAYEFVLKSDGLTQTKFLAQKHCQEAIKQIRCLKSSPEQQSLILITDDIVNRSK